MEEMKEPHSYISSMAALLERFLEDSEIILNIWNSKFILLQPLFWLNFNQFRSILKLMNNKVTNFLTMGIIMVVWWWETEILMRIMEKFHNLINLCLDHILILTITLVKLLKYQLFQFINQWIIKISNNILNNLLTNNIPNNLIECLNLT